MYGAMRESYGIIMMGNRAQLLIPTRYRHVMVNSVIGHVYSLLRYSACLITGGSKDKRMQGKRGPKLFL